MKKTKLIVQTVYENMTDAQLCFWCEHILKGDPQASEIVNELMDSGEVCVRHSDPNSEATKTTRFTLERS